MKRRKTGKRSIKRGRSARERPRIKVNGPKENSKKKNKVGQ